MRKIAKYAVEAQKQALLHFIDRIDNEIITFYHRHLTKINATDAEKFLINMQPYPNIPKIIEVQMSKKF